MLVQTLLRGRALVAILDPEADRRPPIALKLEHDLLDQAITGLALDVVARLTQSFELHESKNVVVVHDLRIQRVQLFGKLGQKRKHRTHLTLNCPGLLRRRLWIRGLHGLLVLCFLF